MAKQNRRRLEKLERARAPARRTVCIWDDGIIDVEAEEARVRADLCLTDADQIIVVRWLPAQN